MKKNIFFLIGAFLPLLIANCRAFGQIVPKFGSIQLTHPIENSVFQQSEYGNFNNVTFRGQILKGTYYTPAQLNNLAVKIQSYNYSSQTWTAGNIQSLVIENCTGCSNDPLQDPKIFYVADNINISLSSGWYRAAVGYTTQLKFDNCNTFTTFIPLTNWSTFGVGDVYFVAGQSNASGFTRLYDTTLLPFETQNQNIPNSNSDNLPPHLIQDNEVPEGSIIYRIKQNRGTENYTPPKGLPLLPQVPLSNDYNGLRKFISGKSGAENVMSIAPNGIDSWSWCRFSKELVTDKKYPVLTFNTAQPNSSISEWESTFFNELLKPTLQMYGGAFGVKAVLWQQGEKETQIMVNAPPLSGQPIYNIDYASKLNQMIGNSRSAMGGNNNMNWVIGKTSFATGGNPPRTDARVTTSVVTSGQYSHKFFANLSNPDNLINKQNSVINGTNVFSGFDSDQYAENYRSYSQKIHLDGYEGTTLASTQNKNGLRLAGEGWYNAVKTIGNTNNLYPKKPNRIKVTKSGSQYLLTIIDPETGNQINSGIFYWIENEGGLNDASKIKSTTNSYLTPASVSTAFYITCYFRATANSPLIPSQPYYVQPTCSGCRIGGITTPLTRNLTIPSSGGNVVSPLDNPKDGTFPRRNNTCIQWAGESFDENSNSLIISASANTTGVTRSGTIQIVDEVTGDIIQTINISQTSSTGGGCTTTNLSSLTPTQASAACCNGITYRNNINFNNNATMKISGVLYPNGVSTHANGSLIYSIGGQGFKTFSGAVGRDDAADNCNCGTQKIQFQIKADGAVLWTSNLLGTTDVAQPFSVNIENRNQLELIVNDGGDNNWGDHADWVNAQLLCGTNTCSVQDPSNPTATINPINAGQNTILSSSCLVGNTKWSTGAAGNSITVNPSVTTTYSVWCENGSGCNSNQKQITVSVNSSGCSLSNGLVMGTWNITGHQLVARNFHGQWWLTQRTSTNPDGFIVRAAQMLQRSDVSLNNSAYSNWISCFSWQYSDYGGLVCPPSSVFPTPSGYTLYYAGDGTPYYLQNTSPPPNCTNTNLTGNWVYATTDFNAPPKINANINNGALNINGQGYGNGIGTHAVSEILYDLGASHNFVTFKAAVGRDQASYSCNCGDQLVQFRVVDNSNGNNLISPVTKGIYQSASNITANIQGVRYLKLVVDIGDAFNWGDWADWANARLECSNSMRKAVQEEDWFHISPNPNDGKFNASIQLKEAHSIQIYVSNAKGDIIKEYTLVGEVGDNILEINLPNLIEGVYHVNCIVGDKTSSKRIVIEK